jgi:hypothetical protein
MQNLPIEKPNEEIVVLEESTPPRPNPVPLRYKCYPRSDFDETLPENTILTGDRETLLGQPPVQTVTDRHSVAGVGAALVWRL